MDVFELDSVDKWRPRWTTRGKQNSIVVKMKSVGQCFPRETFVVKSYSFSYRWSLSIQRTNYWCDWNPPPWCPHPISFLFPRILCQFLYIRSMGITVMNRNGHWINGRHVWIDHDWTPVHPQFVLCHGRMKTDILNFEHTSSINQPTRFLCGLTDHAFEVKGAVVR